MSTLKVVYISIQSSDSSTFKVGAEIYQERTGNTIDLFHVNGEVVDDDPFVYHELVQRSKVADLIVIRCMADPTRMKRFERYEEVLGNAKGT